MELQLAANRRVKRYLNHLESLEMTPYQRTCVMLELIRNPSTKPEENWRFIAALPEEPELLIPT